MKFTEEDAKKYSRGSLIKKINAKESGATVMVVKASTIDRVNQRIEFAIKENHRPPTPQVLDDFESKIFK